MRLKLIDRQHAARIADGLAVALAASLPWSTSATSILVALLLLALIPTIDLSSLRGVLFTPAGGFPVLLVMLAAIGMLWADLPWAERFGGLSPFLKLLFIPLLLYHFQRSDKGQSVLFGFLVSCGLLLCISWAMLAGMPWFLPIRWEGVPAKDYISQSAMLTICALIILRFAHNTWQDNRRALAIAMLVLAFGFVANVFYVSTSRTALVAIPILLFVLGYRLLSWRGAIGLVAVTILLAAAAWPSATFMRQRVMSFFNEVQSFEPTATATSAGLRLEAWRKSVGMLQDEPVVGHGTGSIKEQFNRAAVGQTGMAGWRPANPHNQFFAVGIQLGFVGIVLLLCMWVAHLAFFLSRSFASLIGLLVVIQNIIGSLFNSHLFDFTHGWGYVIGVGLAGGIVLKESALSNSVSPFACAGGFRELKGRSWGLAVRRSGAVLLEEPAALLDANGSIHKCCVTTRLIEDSNGAAVGTQGQALHRWCRQGADRGDGAAAVDRRLYDQPIIAEKGWGARLRRIRSRRCCGGSRPAHFV
jgi:O-antigen ligase